MKIATFDFYTGFSSLLVKYKVNSSNSIELLEYIGYLEDFEEFKELFDLKRVITAINRTNSYNFFDIDYEREIELFIEET